MFFRKVTTRRGDKEYVYLKLIENYRDGGKVKQRVIANLGNIDRLAPEKVEALISGLTKFCPASALTSYEPDTPAPSVDDAYTEPIRTVWRDLNLPTILTEAEQHFEPPGRFTALIEAAVIAHILNPQDTRPLSVRCADINIPPLDGEEIPGIVFFQAFCRLADLIPSLERHLLNQLQERLGRPFALFLHPQASEFIGHECGITTAGTSYHIRPYRRPLPLALLAHPSGLPVSCRLVPGGLNLANLAPGQKQCRESYDLDVYLLIEEKLLGTTPAPQGAVVSLSPKRFAGAPFTNADPWAENGIISDQRWIKTVKHEGHRYILSHDLALDNPSNRTLDDDLAQAARELDKLRTAVRQKKLRREKTIRRRAHKILEEHGCLNYIDHHYDPNTPDYRYTVHEEVIKKEKMLRRTRVLRTDLQSPAGKEIAGIYDACTELAKEFTVIQDITRLPVVYPYADHQHSEAYIEGLLQIYTLAALVRRLASIDST